MQFKVNFKGIVRYSGTLGFAVRYVEDQWGSLAQAYELGVKLIPAR